MRRCSQTQCYESKHIECKRLREVGEVIQFNTWRRSMKTHHTVLIEGDNQVQRDWWHDLY